MSGMTKIELSERRRRLSRESRVESLRDQLRWIAEHISDEQLLASERQINDIRAEVVAQEIGE
jgi:hypothetical protein